MKCGSRPICIFFMSMRRLADLRRVRRAPHATTGHMATWRVECTRAAQAGEVDVKASDVRAKATRRVCIFFFSPQTKPGGNTYRRAERNVRVVDTTPHQAW